MADIQLTLYATDSPIVNHTKFPKAMKAVTRFAWKIFHDRPGLRWNVQSTLSTKHGLMIEDRNGWVSLISFIFGLRYWVQWPDSKDNTSIIHGTKYFKKYGTHKLQSWCRALNISPLCSNYIQTPRRNETNLDSLKSETWSAMSYLR